MCSRAVELRTEFLRNLTHCTHCRFKDQLRGRRQMHSRFDIPCATDAAGAGKRSRRDWRASSVAFLCLAAPLLGAVVSASRAADMDVSRDPSYNWGESK